ncbi:hypothetical protein PR048_011090 [Dryococelus australis]|uniref:Uncharacterized protein n=1 Tax=Dryococelus australis TaxID=614101 RepID=A0ABQ9HKN2_9NEOP|nr:hypothetical protein PR048_011090 [Dryococelus australis]
MTTIVTERRKLQVVQPPVNPCASDGDESGDSEPDILADNGDDDPDYCPEVSARNGLLVIPELESESESDESYAGPSRDSSVLRSIACSHTTQQRSEFRWEEQDIPCTSINSQGIYDAINEMPLQLHKITPVLDSVVENYWKQEHEAENSIDEMMVPYKRTKAGNLRQYIQNKSHK